MGLDPLENDGVVVVQATARRWRRRTANVELEQDDLLVEGAHVPTGTTSPELLTATLANAGLEACTGEEKAGGGTHAALASGAESGSAPRSCYVFTLGQDFLEAQLQDAMRLHSLRAVLDARIPSVAATSALTKRTIARVCAREHVHYEELTLPQSCCNGEFLSRRLRSAVAFVPSPVALLFAERNPRNGARREAADALARAHASICVIHLSPHGTMVEATPHEAIFGHEGNSVVWPPSVSEMPGLEEIALSGFSRDVIRDRSPYLVRLPWETDLLWVPAWLSQDDADELKDAIETCVTFSQPVLRFHRGFRNVEGIQPRRSAWVTDRFNQPEQLAAARAAGTQLEPTVLAAHKLEPWSRAIFAQAEQSASAKFNALLLHTYDHGRHSMGFHSDSDVGLGDRAIIGSFSLGETRNFVIRSQSPWEGRRIELTIPMCHGSFLVMGPGFQGRWLHAVPKDPTVGGDRINGTFRFYDLPEGSALCACGASERRSPIVE